MTASDDTCAVCRRAQPPVCPCPSCRRRMFNELNDLPQLWNELQTALVPGPGGGERIASGKGEAPIPARLSALTLIAGGSDDARCVFVPAVRVWTTVVQVDDKPVKVWHREAMRDAAGRRVMTLVDDQAGVLPLREWLRAWALEWRRCLDHSTEHHRRGGTRPSRLAVADDPTAEEWAARWPLTDWGAATRDHYWYLMTWLDAACESLPHIGDFAASLRTLTGAVRAALGDGEDLEYLGRCPEEVEDRDHHTTICGAALWHDPYASLITCPRCHAETPNERRIWLARRILDAWPIDRRRRYPRGLIDVLRTPTCDACGGPLAVEWIDATESADREPLWRPGTIACPAGCDASA
jgi:hypothetical protein